MALDFAVAEEPNSGLQALTVAFDEICSNGSSPG